MKTEILKKKLRENKTVLPSCLMWSTEDIDLRMNALGKQSELALMTDEEKLYLLDAFFKQHEDQFMEFINWHLESWLKTNHNILELPF
jgi:hypothetical protein